MDDALSDVLRLVRLKSCVYFMSDFCTPWAMQVGDGSVAQFHVIVRGQCTVEIGSARHDAVTGDVLLFPRGRPHVLRDGEACKPVPGLEVLRSINNQAPVFGAGGTATRLMCGHYEYDQDVRHPLFEELPDFIHLKSFETVAPESLQNVIPLLLQEMNSGRPGSETTVERLAEILLIQVLRGYVSRRSNVAGFLSALSDSRLARSIKLIHARAEDKLTLDDLASAAAMSRSAYALLFKSKTRLSPVAYLTKWRMYKARELLHAGQLTLDQIAERVGYQSDIAFSRAFRREFNDNPSNFRKAARQRAAS